MLKEELEATEKLIKEMISQYRSQFESDISGYKEQSKKELEILKGTFQGTVDGVLDRFEKKLHGDLVQGIIDKVQKIILEKVDLEHVFSSLSGFETKIVKYSTNSEKLVLELFEKFEKRVAELEKKNEALKKELVESQEGLRLKLEELIEQKQDKFFKGANRGKKR